MAEYSYDAWGNNIGSSGAQAGANPYRFSTHEQLSSGLYDMGARVYSPSMGRFLSRDPVGESVSFNLYEYGYNDPLSWGDPDGAEPITLALVWAAVEVGLVVYDTVVLVNTLTDPCTGMTEKVATSALYAVGVFGVGGGYTMLGKKAAKEVCFIAGTKIAMADGTSKPIEEVKAGDRVLSRDEATGKTQAKRVEQTFERTAEATLVLHLSSGEQIETTEEHPFYVEGRGFVAAKELGIGTSIVTRAGPTVRVLSVERKDAPATVYNFEVQDYHTYFVGDAQVWVHNQCKPVTREDRWRELAHEPNSRLPKEIIDHINRYDGKRVSDRFGLELAHRPKKSAVQGHDYSDTIPKTAADLSLISFCS